MKKQSPKNKAIPKIAENFKKHRKGISKSELVRRTGLDYHTLSKIESGNTPNPRINTVVKIAAALDKTLDQMVA